MPTPGKCYENTIQALIARRYDTPGTSCVLCHGYPRLTRAAQGHPAGTLYGHAWLERGEENHTICIDVLTGSMVPKIMFYAVGRVDPEFVDRYTPDEAWEKLKQYRHHGPWGDVPPGVVFGK